MEVAICIYALILNRLPYTGITGLEYNALTRRQTDTLPNTLTCLMDVYDTTASEYKTLYM